MSKDIGRRLALSVSAFAALLAIWAIAFSLRMGYADKFCRDLGYTEARASWNFKMNCLTTTGVENEREDSVLPAVQAGSGRAHSGPR